MLFFVRCLTCSDCRLRDLSVTKQAENETLKKQSETLEHRVKVLTKENENVKADLTVLQATIADLKEQVSSKHLSIVRSHSFSSI